MRLKVKKKHLLNFTLSCFMPFLQSDLYGSDLKRKIERLYMHAAIDYAMEHGYSHVRFLRRYDSPYGHGTDFYFEAYND